MISYGPLVGVPSAPALHQEESAFLRLVLAGLGSRETSERCSLLSSRKHGGLQLASVVEAMVSAVATDVILLLNGCSLASLVARDSVREGMEVDPDAADKFVGLIPNAMRFLAGYGLYVNVSTDRTVSRMLDAKAGGTSGPSGHPMVGTFVASSYDRSVGFCRIGRLANTLRRALANVRALGAAKETWSQPQTWVGALQGLSAVSAAECSNLARKALAAESSDWAVERQLLASSDAACPQACAEENWSLAAWESPWTHHHDHRSRWLDSVRSVNAQGQDFAVFGDGGFTKGAGATFAAQVRTFGERERYFEEGSPTGDEMARRLPARYGHEDSSIHMAELASLLVALRWRRCGQWNLYVGDRKAVFDSVARLIASSPNCLSKSSNINLETRLQAIFQELKQGWGATPSSPSWRLNQEHFHSVWNDQRKRAADDDRLIWLSRIAVCSSGWVGVDVHSHQSGTAAPYPMVTAGNEAVDALCDTARSLPRPADVAMPSGGCFAFLSFDGRSITAKISCAVRSLLREQALRAWAKRAVQGKIARTAHKLFAPCLDAKMYCRCVIPQRIEALLLPGDDPAALDLSKVFFRIMRGIGGAWTELTHARHDVLVLAGQWGEETGAASLRTCPLCTGGPGTPRHVIMTCTCVSEVRDQVRDVIEAELCRHVERSVLLAAADEWWESMEERGMGSSSRAAVSNADKRRWPVLARWRWLVSMPSREALFSRDVGGHSSEDVRAECEVDLAYRGVIPRALGYVLRETSDTMDPESSSEEDFATANEADAAMREASRARSRWSRAGAGKEVAVALVLGLRKIRASYVRQIEAWCELRRLACATPSGPEAEEGEEEEDEDPAAPPAPAVSRTVELENRISAWAATANGCHSIAQLRWLIPDHSTAVARIRAELAFPTGAGEKQIRAAIERLGIPVRQGDVVSWGADLPSWEEVKARWCCQCECPAVPQQHGLAVCGGCGGVMFPSHGQEPMPGICRWCSQPCMEVCSSCYRGVHLRGQCKWNHGASPLYVTFSQEGKAVCPDCLWDWVCMCDVQPSSTNPDTMSPGVNEHMHELAGNCLPGAGSTNVEPGTSRPSFGRGRARRWVLAYLASRAWTRKRSVVAAFLSAMRSRSGNPSPARVEGVLSGLIQSGHLLEDGSGVHSAVRVSAPSDLAAPHRAVHVRRSRRRRRASRVDEPDESPPRQRRRL